MVALIQNEQMKIFRQVGTWVMIGIFILLCIGLPCTSLFAKHEINEKEINAEIKDQKATLKNPNLSEKKKKQINDDIHMKEMCLKKGVDPFRVMLVIGMLIGLPLLLVKIFTIIIASGIMGKEFSTGAIKLLLIRPYTRASILVSKYLSTILFGALLILVHYVLSIGIMSILFTSSFIPIIHGMFWTSYGLEVVQIIIYLTMAFMISTVFRNQGLAIGLSLFFAFAGSMIMNYVRDHSWSKYILFANVDLSPPDGTSLTFSVTVVLVYYIIFLLATWYSFNKRDVAI